MRAVSNINTLIAAYRFGEIFKETSYAKGLYKNFYKLEESLSEKTWSIYTNVLYTCKFAHYYSFGMAYKKIKHSQVKDNMYLQDAFIELKDCNELHSLIKLSDKLAKNLEQSYEELSRNLPTMESNEILSSFQLYRTWLDLFYNLHSTKFFYYLQSKIGKEGINDKLIQKYFEQREIYPYSSRNRRLIRSLGNEDKQHNMWFLEFFDSIRKSVLQLIFEAHFDFQLKINQEEAIQLRGKEFSKIRILKVKTYGLSRGNFLILYRQDKIQDIGLVRRRVVTNFGEKRKALSTITSLLYPRSDQELFFMIE